MKITGQMACCSLLGVLAAVMANGQESRAGSLSSFGEAVDVTVANLEVYVEDKDGQPIRGLVEADFELLENGKVVALTNFYAVDDGRRVVGESSALEGGEEAERGTKVSSSVVVYVDNANLSAFHRNRALEKVEVFLRQRLERGDRAMLVSYGGSLQLEVSLTDSMRELTRGLDKLAEMTLVDQGPDARRRQGLDELVSLHLALAGKAGTITGEGEGPSLRVASGEGDRPCEPQLGEVARSYARVAYDNVKRTVEALGQFTDTLSGLPGRKVLLYVSDGLPAIPGQEAFEFLHQVCGGGAANAGVRDKVFDFSSGSDPEKLNIAALASEGVSFNAASLYEALTERANANQVTFFTLEASGPRQGSAASAESRTMLESLQAVDTVAHQNLQDSLFTMAAQTGGRAVLNAGDLGPGLESIAADLDTFYSLGYTSQGQIDQAQRVEVRVKRPGARVRYRKSFTAKDSQTLMADRTQGTLLYGVEDNPMGFAVEVGLPVRLDDQLHSVPIRVRIPLGKLVLLEREGKHHGRVTLQLAARDRQGRLAPVRSAAVPLAIPADRLEEARGKLYLYEIKMLMREGDHTVAVGLRDEIAQQTSFVLAAVPVGEGVAAASANE